MQNNLPGPNSPTYTPQPYPLYPPPPMPPKKRRNWLLWGIAALLVLAVIVIFANLNNVSTSTPPTATQAPAAGNTPAATQPPAPTPTHPTKFPATHGRPHIGGPFSDFIGKYGQPIGQGLGNSYNFQSDTKRPDGSLPPGPNVTPNATGMVIGLDIVSDSTTTVSFDQARLHCEVWLPSDAVEFNSAPPFGLVMLNRLPQVLTLRPASQQVTMSTQPGISTVQIAHTPQYNMFLRTLYFLLVGWWAGYVWAVVGYLLCAAIVTLPLGLVMLNRLPMVITLRRN